MSASKRTAPQGNFLCMFSSSDIPGQQRFEVFDGFGGRQCIEQPAQGSKSLARHVCTKLYRLALALPPQPQKFGWGGRIIRPCGPHPFGAALRALSFRSQTVLTNQFPADLFIAPTKFGWGGRIRTSVWRDQNPLPYRLATPHKSIISEPALVSAGRQSFKQGRVVQSASQKSIHRRW